MSESNRDPPIVNPYAAPAAAPRVPDSVSTGSIDEQHLQAFVGPNAKYYLKRWKLLLSESGHSAGFNWAAFLLSGLWLPYRKMYRVSIIFYTIILVESIAEELLFVGFLGKEETPAGFAGLVGIVIAAVCGANGNRWYLSHARHVISEVCAQGIENPSIAYRLSKRGGTSLGAALGFFFLFAVMMIAVSIGLVLLLD